MFLRLIMMFGVAGGLWLNDEEHLFTNTLIMPAVVVIGYLGFRRKVFLHSPFADSCN